MDEVQNIIEIEEQLGEGGFGTVWAGKYILTGDPVAVKVMQLSDLREAAASLLAQEYKIIKDLHHPNIVNYLQVFESESEICLVMEKLEGGSLNDLCKYLGKKGARLSELQISEIMKGILTGIKFLHQHNIIHRDIKPSNLLFLRKGDYDSIKIIDFGISAKCGNGLFEVLNLKVGTPKYIAPELSTKKFYQKPIDIWGAGMVMYNLLITKDHRHSMSNFPSPESRTLLKKFCSKLSIDFLERLTSMKPSERYTASEALSHPYITRLVSDIPLSVEDTFTSFKLQDKLRAIARIIFMAAIFKGGKTKSMDPQYRMEVGRIYDFLVGWRGSRKHRFSNDGDFILEPSPQIFPQSTKHINTNNHIDQNIPNKYFLQKDDINITTNKSQPNNLIYTSQIVGGKNTGKLEKVENVLNPRLNLFQGEQIKNIRELETFKLLEGKGGEGSKIIVQTKDIKHIVRQIMEKSKQKMKRNSLKKSELTTKNEYALFTNEGSNSPRKQNKNRKSLKKDGVISEESKNILELKETPVNHRIYSKLGNERKYNQNIINMGDRYKESSKYSPKWGIQTPENCRSINSIPRKIITKEQVSNKSNDQMKIIPDSPSPYHNLSKQENSRENLKKISGYGTPTQNKISENMSTSTATSTDCIRKNKFEGGFLPDIKEKAVSSDALISKFPDFALSQSTTSHRLKSLKFQGMPVALMKEIKILKNDGLMRVHGKKQKQMNSSSNEQSLTPESPSGISRWGEEEGELGEFQGTKTYDQASLGKQMVKSSRTTKNNRYNINNLNSKHSRNIYARNSNNILPPNICKTVIDKRENNIDININIKQDIIYNHVGNTLGIHSTPNTNINTSKNTNRTNEENSHRANCIRGEHINDNTLHKVGRIPIYKVPLGTKSYRGGGDYYNYLLQSPYQNPNLPFPNIQIQNHQINTMNKKIDLQEKLSKLKNMIGKIGKEHKSCSNNRNCNKGAGNISRNNSLERERRSGSNMISQYANKLKMHNIHSTENLTKDAIKLLVLNKQ